MIAAAVLIAVVAPGTPEGIADPTASALARCLDDAENASTAGQTDCQATARDGYDRRMNLAYTALTKRLPPPAVRQLRDSQRGWLAFRAREAEARRALYATRQGTMFVPMEAGDETNLVRDRALQLEAYLRVIHIAE